MGRFARIREQVLCRVLVAAVAIHVLLASTSVLPDLVPAFLSDLSVLTGACLAVTAGGTQARAWRLIGLGVAGWGAGDLIWHVTQLTTGHDPASPGIPDLFYLALYPLAWAGISRLGTGDRRRVGINAALDGVAAGLLAVAALAVVLLEPVRATATGSTLEVITSLAYPLGDTLLLALLAGLIAARGWRFSPTLLCVGGALLLNAASDATWALAPTVGDSASYLDSLWLMAAVALCLASRRPVELPTAAAPPPVSARALAAPSVIAFVALGAITVDRVHPLGLLCFVASVAALGVVVARAVLAFRENAELLERSREMAHVDPLTLLANRRALQHDLDAVLAAGRPLLLVLFDLDGFKRYNDTYGHPAGDRLLTRLAARLRLAVEPDGRAYRMGGDEFCIVIEREAAAETIARAHRALTEHADGFTVTATAGIVELLVETDDQTTALQLADNRMYARKRPGHRDGARAPVAVPLPRTAAAPR